MPSTPANHRSGNNPAYFFTTSLLLATNLPHLIPPQPTHTMRFSRLLRNAQEVLIKAESGRKFVPFFFSFLSLFFSVI